MDDDIDELGERDKNEHNLARQDCLGSYNEDLSFKNSESNEIVLSNLSSVEINRENISDSYNDISTDNNQFTSEGFRNSSYTDQSFQVFKPLPGRGIDNRGYEISNSSISEHCDFNKDNYDIFKGQNTMTYSNNAAFMCNINELNSSSMSSNSNIVHGNTTNPSINPTSSDRINHSKDGISLNKPENESTKNVTNSNKRRYPGGISVGAPAPKIKRKRQNIQDPKLHQHSSSLVLNPDLKESFQVPKTQNFDQIPITGSTSQLSTNQNKYSSSHVAQNTLFPCDFISQAHPLLETNNHQNNLKDPSNEVSSLTSLEKFAAESNFTTNSLNSDACSKPATSLNSEPHSKDDSDCSVDKNKYSEFDFNVSGSTEIDKSNLAFNEVRTSFENCLSSSDRFADNESHSGRKEDVYSENQGTALPNFNYNNDSISSIQVTEQNILDDKDPSTDIIASNSTQGEICDGKTVINAEHNPTERNYNFEDKHLKHIEHEKSNLALSHGKLSNELPSNVCKPVNAVSPNIESTEGKTINDGYESLRKSSTEENLNFWGKKSNSEIHDGIIPDKTSECGNKVVDKEDENQDKNNESNPDDDKKKPKEKSNKEGKLSDDETSINNEEKMKPPPAQKAAGGVTGLSAKPKVKNLRRNIRDIITDDKLEENTLAAQKEEQLRLQRLQEKQMALREYMEQQQVERLVAEVAEAAEAVTAAEAVEAAEAAKEEESEFEVKVKQEVEDVVVLSSEEDEPKDKECDMEELLKPKTELKSGDEDSMDDSDQKSSESDESSECESDSDVIVLSHSEEDDDEAEDVNSSGAHINDQFNVPDAQGRVLVNVGHPDDEEDIFLAPQLSLAAKSHQIGGIRFLYDNIIESVEQFKTSNGFGCILAHSMGLGKTLQVVAFTDILLRHTDAKHILIIVPINTLQNWQNEFNQWLREASEPPAATGILGTHGATGILGTPGGATGILGTPGGATGILGPLGGATGIIGTPGATGNSNVPGNPGPPMYTGVQGMSLPTLEIPRTHGTLGSIGMSLLTSEIPRTHRTLGSTGMFETLTPVMPMTTGVHGISVPTGDSEIPMTRDMPGSSLSSGGPGTPVNTGSSVASETPGTPEKPTVSEEPEFRCRHFKVFILNDIQKTLPSRAKVISKWHEVGGVLLMGYELYRQLSLKKPKKPKMKRRRKNQPDKESVVDIEEEDKNKLLLDEMHKYLVRPGPDLVICDEGHRIKNAHANISQALKNIRTKRRVVLTGYPLQNNLIEYWCMVDFVRPNYLGTKTEFCNMFERPIQNGQCVDSTPQDVKVMRYRAHVLHSLLEGFVQRRGHSVLAKTLPMKQEHVLLCRMTKIQQTLYRAYMSELKVNKAVANPLRAFAICCKIWNHPDVLYNFVKKKINEDIDLDLDEVVGKSGKGRKSAKHDSSKVQPDAAPPPFTSSSAPNWNMAQNHPMGRSPCQSMPPHPSQMNMGPMPSMGMQNPMGQQGSMQSGMGHPGALPHGNNPMHNMGMGMGMNYGMGMYSMQQNYMHQMGPQHPYPWGYGQGYPNPNNPNTQQHFPSPNNQYGHPYSQNQFQQSHPMQQQQQQQQQLPLPHQQQQQSIPPSQGLNPYPSMSQMMSNSMSMSSIGQPLNASSQSSHLMHDQNVSGMHHSQTSSTNRPQPDPSMQSLPTNHSLMSNNNPIISEANSLNLLNQTLSDGSNQQTMQGQSNESNLLGSSNLSGEKDSIPVRAQNPSFQKDCQTTAGNPFEPDQESISDLLQQNMKDLGIDEKANDNNDLLLANESLQNINNSGDVKPKVMDIKPSLDSSNKFSLTEDGIKADKENQIKKDLISSAESVKDEKMDDGEKKEDIKKDELLLDWAESLFKDYVPGLLENSSKFQIFFKIVEGSLEIGDRLLVFSQSLFTLSLLEEYLQRYFIPGTYEKWAKNRSYFRLDGSTSAQEREKLISEFNCNTYVRIFLVSTRAGSLGINLVGANRVIVFDASFNPCHDTQAVCRVYRYGQRKPCHIYRLVTDNSLERRIYDRQVNKQGIADRIVDEMNPDAHLSSKEISNLLVDNEEELLEDESDGEDLKADEASFEDDILAEIIKEKSGMFTRLPFKHESLLVDRKDKKLSNAEKRLAKRSYELEKQANISYGRPSSYSKTSGSQGMMIGTKIGGVVYAKPVGTVRPMQSEMGQRIEGGGTMMHRPNILQRSQSNRPVENLAKQGVSVQQITVPKDVSIPTNSGDGKPIQLKSGQSVMVIRTQKGVYLRLSDGKIIAIRTPPEEAFGLPLNQGSVTIVPTMGGSARGRGRGRGGFIPTRRGRPPMSAQYALGQVVPKGTAKGQMAVRILRKPIASGRGGKSYQTVAVPVSSTGHGTLLNKSVIITPAKSGASQSKFLKDLKISPKVQITPVPSKARSSLSSIGGTSGLTKRLNRNNKIMTAQANALKMEEEKRLKMKNLAQNAENSSDAKNAEERTENEDSERSGGNQNDASSQALAEASAEENASTSSESNNANVTYSQTVAMETETDAGAGAPESHSEDSLKETSLDTTEISAAMSESSKPLSSLSNEGSSNQVPSPTDDSVQSSSAAPTALNSSNVTKEDNSTHMEEMTDRVNTGKSKLKGHKPPHGFATSEPIMGIVKPIVQQGSPTISPLQGLSNLVSPGDAGPAPQSSQSSFSASALPSTTHGSSFSQTLPSSQPLFQPFLQQPLVSTGSSSSISSITTTSEPTNVALVTPQIHSSVANMTSRSFISPSPASFPNLAQGPSPIHSLQSFANPLQSSVLPFGSLNDGSSSNQGQRSSSSIASTAISLSGSSFTSSVLSSSNTSAGSDAPLNLSSLLSNQSFAPVSVSEDVLPHHSSSPLDYLNYSLPTSSSAFRRPEFSSALPPDIQNLLNSPPQTSLPVATSQQHSSSVSSTQPSTISISSPGAFPAPTPVSPYSQFASSFSGQTNPTGFRPAQMLPGYPTYPGQYASYASQYPNLSPHPSSLSQTPSMSQYGSPLQPTASPYQGYPPPPSGTGIPSPYSSGLGGFGHSPYPPM